jgi:hypothetical protein
MFRLIKLILLLLVTLSFAACRKDEPTVAQRRLKNCYVEYLNFYGDVKYYHYTQFLFSPYDVNPKISFEYSGNEVKRTNGGFLLVVSLEGSSFIFKPCFSGDAYDSIIRQGNQTFVYSKPESSWSLLDIPGNPTVYNTDSDGRLVKITRRDGYNFHYVYQNDQIIERNDAGQTLRTFYLENNNLVRIVSESGEIYSPDYKRNEIRFGNFDTNPNPFRNMFYLTGAFYRAFSQNNFSEYTISNFAYWDEDSSEVMQTYWAKLHFTYDKEGYPVFGEYE